jgi:hypothetical protein
MVVLSVVPFNLSGDDLHPVRKEVPPKKAPAAVAPDSLRKFLLVTGMNILLDKIYIYFCNLYAAYKSLTSIKCFLFFVRIDL